MKRFFLLIIISNFLLLQHLCATKSVWDGKRSDTSWYDENATNYHINSAAQFKGFADLVLIPRKNVDSPAIVLELKCNKDADTAIDQIKRKNYPAKVLEYTDNLLLVGINYDRQTKQHKCHIEKAE